MGFYFFLHPEHFCLHFDFVCLSEFVVSFLLAGGALVAFGFCHLVGKFGPKPYAVFPVGGSDACPMVGSAGSCPTDKQDHVKVYV